MTATFQNLGFELAGAAPGLAAGWVLRCRASVEEIAGYGTPERPAEDFERGWSGNEAFGFSLSPATVEPAVYGATTPAETFEGGWAGNEGFGFGLGALEAAQYGGWISPRPLRGLPAPRDGIRVGSTPFDGFETQWAGNDTFAWALASSALEPGPIDGFESGWRGNETALFAFDAANLALGPTESFESAWSAHLGAI